MPGEKFPTSGGENHENELSREQKVEQLDEKDIKLLQQAAEELGLTPDSAFTYEDDMDDATLDKFLNKVKELENGGGDAGGNGSETNTNTGENNNSQGSGESAENQERKERTQEEKKKYGEHVWKKAAIYGTLGALGIGMLVGPVLQKLTGNSKAKQDALDNLNNGTGVEQQVGDEEDSSAESSEAEHQYGERYENIAEVSTTHGHFANEDGTGYNEEKDNNYCFSAGYELTDNEQNRKDQICEELVQTETLGTYYTYFGEHAEAAGLDNYGVDGIDYKNANSVIDAIENDDEKHQDVYDYVYDLIQNENTHVSQEKISGHYANYYMTADFSKGDLDESKDLTVVGCYTDESDTDVFNTSFALENSSGVLIKFDGDLKVVCTQPIDESLPDGYTVIDLDGEPDTDMDLDRKDPPSKTPPSEEKDPAAIKERAGDDVDPMGPGEKTDTNATNEDSDGDGTNDADEFNSDDGNDGSTGGEENHEGEDGDINNNINNADQDKKNDVNVEDPDARAKEEAEAADAKQKDEDAKQKADEEEKNDHEKPVSMEDLGF